jgi:2'-5' RNA ligase
MRVFAALSLSPEFQAALWENLEPLRKHYPGFRWVRQIHFHITLAFLGSLDRRGVSILEDAVREAAGRTGRIPMAPGRLLSFPAGRSPTVLAYGVDRGSHSITALAGAIETNLRTLGQGYPFREPEQRPLVPHITLARKGETPLALRPESWEHRFPRVEPLTTVTIFESRPSREGAMYFPLSVCALAD